MPWVTPSMTLNAEGEPGAEFGTAIAFYADKMVIGAPGDVHYEDGVSTGSVYVFGLGNDGHWVAEAKLYQNFVGVGSCIERRYTRCCRFIPICDFVSIRQHYKLMGAS